MTAIQLIRLIGDEFKDIDDETLEQWIEVVKPMVSKAKFGNLYEQAIALLVCHRLKLSGKGESGEFGTIGDTANVASYSEGSRSVSFNNGFLECGKEGSLGLTSYGLQYVELRRSVITPITCSGGVVDGRA